jgi:hypothetical protein
VSFIVCVVLCAVFRLIVVLLCVMCVICFLCLIVNHCHRVKTHLQLINITLNYNQYVGVLISLWLFLFAAEPNEFFLDGLMKLEQRSHKCLELRGDM